MRAVTIQQQGGPEVIRVEDRPTPDPGPGEALVRVRACGVNWLDVWVRAGSTPIKIPMPHIMGSEVAGEVAAVGPGGQRLSEGDRIAVHPYLHCGVCEFCLKGEETICLRGDILGLVSDGGYAEFVKVPLNSILPLPANVEFDDAAAVTLSAITAWHMLVRRARIRAGETVLVLAAGSGVGSAALQIAKLAGARVIATAGSDDKVERARALGADETINHTEQDIREEVRRITQRRGVDVVVEHVGQATWSASVASLARNGRLVTCGATTGPEGKLDIWSLFAKQIQVIGSYGGTRGDLAQVLALLADGKLKATIFRRFKLEEVAEAISLMERREQFGKMVVNP